MPANVEISMKLKLKYTVFLLLLSFSAFSSFSQDSLQVAPDSSKIQKFLINGYVKDLQMILFQDVRSEWTTANLIHNRINLKWLPSSSITAALELRNRFFYGDMLTKFPGYNKSFETDRGFLNLTRNVLDERSFLFNTSIDRLWLQYSNQKLQLTAGRQRINWGQTFVWNPNDIFNTYSYFDFDYEEKPGSDAVRVQYFLNPTSVLEIAGKLDAQHKGTAAGLYRFNKRNYDIQFLGGLAESEDYVVGMGWSGQILKGGFRGEASYFHPKSNRNDSIAVFLASVGYDYTFKNSLFLQLEALYNGNDRSSNILSLNQLNTSNINTKNLFLSGYSYFGSLSYPFTPLLNGSLAGITNFKNKMFFINPSVSYSLMQNLELMLTSQIINFYGSSLLNQNLTFIFFRLKGSF
jgi:hypothetical protein